MPPTILGLPVHALILHATGLLLPAAGVLSLVVVP